MTSPESLQEHIHELEERLLLPGVRGSRQTLDAMLGDEFIEFASDGTVYDKSRVIDALQAEALCQRSISEFRLVAMGRILCTLPIALRNVAIHRRSLLCRCEVQFGKSATVGGSSYSIKALSVWRPDSAINTDAPPATLHASRGSPVTLMR